MNSHLEKYVLQLQQMLLGFDSREALADTSTLSKLPPIFILAPPRSGSTAIFQHLISKYQSSYITNLMALAPKYMLFSAKLQKNSLGKNTIKTNSYGFTPGLNAPSEAGAVNRLWFEKEYNKHKVRNTIAFLSQLSGGNFINKNLYNCLRIEEIVNILPECKFIRIRRNSSYVSQSLLLAKKKFNVPEDKFWSVTPPGAEKLTFNSQEEQVAWQTTELEKIIESKLTNKHSYSTIEYDSFCENPEETINTLASELNLSPRNHITTEPRKKTHSQQINVSRPSWEKIQQAVSYYEKN